MPLPFYSSTLTLKVPQPKFKANQPQEQDSKYFCRAPNPLTIATELGFSEKDILLKQGWHFFQTIPLECSPQSARDGNGRSGRFWPSTNQVLCWILRDLDYYRMKQRNGSISP